MRSRSEHSLIYYLPVRRPAKLGGGRGRTRHRLSALALALAWTIPSTVLAANAAPRDAVGIVRFLDADGDGRLDRHEIRGTPGMAAFLWVDTDRDGFLDADELRAEGLGSFDPIALVEEPVFGMMP